MIKHTPGPWTRGYGNYVYRDDVGQKDGKSLIATCMPLNVTRAELETAFANARLIAAAPELLAALQWLADSADDCPALDWCLTD
jgi:hypothetical protein